MNASRSKNVPGKRDRLIEGAKTLLHERGFAAASLADIAAASDVPIGNVYYYFRTKDDLARAVIETRLEEIEGALASFGKADDPRERLARYVEAFAGKSEMLSRFGCPHGCLAHEFERIGGELGALSGRLLARQCEWAEEQFRESGSSPSEAAREGADLVALIQGTVVVAQARKDPDFLRDRLARLARTARRRERDAG